MYLKTGKMELRGIAQKTSRKTGKPYRVAHMEEAATGEPVEVYIGDGFEAFGAALKGDMFELVFSRNKYGSLDLVAAEVCKK